MMDYDSHAPEPSQRCAQLSKPSVPQFVVSCLLITWLLAANIPQWVRIAKRQSAEGLSTFYILLGSMSGVCAVGNILMLPSTDEDMGCCRTNSTFACINGILGMLQVIMGIACFWVVLIMYVYYAEEEADAEIHGRRASLSGPDRTFRRARRAWIVLIVVCSFAFTILLASTVISRRFPWVAQTWADILGVGVALLACVQWLPQVLTSWHLGSLGSLSLVALSISAPYTWIFGVSMMLRVGVQGWSAWIVYLIVGFMQLILIAMGITYSVRDWQRPLPPSRSRNTSETPSNRPSFSQFQFGVWNGSRHSMVSSNVAPDEHRPLLAGHRSGGSAEAAGSPVQQIG
ncbi:hypothetical protein B0I35DRAFT_440666 [Stachybotrys elegans]|uniref:PQ loop repeat protein n=1 Tax=Stachybotrys elegans TaxID=80388 RepID=A0A8K0WN86_9HYPO|nr:hypothetical protein B0I35DRAFT_440666 [Stachybotrys elegans]